MLRYTAVKNSDLFNKMEISLKGESLLLFFILQLATIYMTFTSKAQVKNMKNIVLIGLFFIGLRVSAQTNESQVNLFGQCMIEIATAEEMKTLELEMKSNPYIKVVRLDYNTQRAFILTKGIDQLSEDQFSSWFSNYANKVRCIQIGRHGIDQVKPYPFEGCGKE